MCTLREHGPPPVEEEELAFNGSRTFDRDEALQDMLDNTNVFRMELTGAKGKT